MVKGAFSEREKDQFDLNVLQLIQSAEENLAQLDKNLKNKESFLRSGNVTSMAHKETVKDVLYAKL